MSRNHELNLRDLGSNGKLWLCRRNGFLELHVQLEGIATGLHLASDHPSTYFINQRTQYATVHGVHPALIIVLRIPFTYDIVTILIELQMKSDGIVWTTTKAVVLRMVAPRVYYLLHISSSSSCDNPFASAAWLLPSGRAGADRQRSR